jgi:ATP synthase mitochondrial F1 complex assembly factor 1
MTTGIIANRFWGRLAGKRQMLLFPTSTTTATTTATSTATTTATTTRNQRCFSFIFTGRRLADILKKELVQDKPSTEVADLWYTYHENKPNVHGWVTKGDHSKTILKRATESPFFIQPVFRDNGYFMLVSQYQDPCHFLMAYLEDFKMDPAAAQPLLTFSVYDDYADSKDLTLIRAEIINSGIEDDEGRKIVQNMVDGYTNDDEYMIVKAFNKKPESFDLDDYVARQNVKWRQGKQADVEQ